MVFPCGWWRRIFLRYACRVVKFNPLDKSLTEIGPDLGERGYKWRCGARANTGSIYCTPYFSDHILKINTNDDTVETLDNVELPERGGHLWSSGALAQDNSIYYMPYSARWIMKLNPDNDTLSIAGNELGEGAKYEGTVVGSDDCVYTQNTELQIMVFFDFFKVFYSTCMIRLASTYSIPSPLSI